jgi:hypothetical protein
MKIIQEQLKKSFPTPLVRKASKSIEQLVLLIMGLQYDTNLEAVVMRCISFLSAITNDGIVLGLKDILFKYVLKANSEMPTEFSGKTVPEMYNVENHTTRPEGLGEETQAAWATLKRGIFTNHLSYILGTAFAVSTCKIKNVEFSHPIFESIMKHSQKDTINGVDLVDHMIKLYNWISTVGVACIETRSLDPLICNSGSLAKCHERFYHWNNRFRQLKLENNSSIEERKLMFVEITAVHADLMRFCKTERDKFTTLQASSLFKEVSVLLSDITEMILRVDAVRVSFALHIHGVPKVGKSQIVPKICAVVCHAAGQVYRPRDVAQPNLCAAFMDELHNDTQVVVCNEVNPIKEHLAKSVENAYLTSLALVDPVPFHPNRSNLDDKAKITAQHILTISTGNTEQPYINVANTLGAWERRYLSVHMRVKEQFQDQFGRMDASKADGSDNYHLFDVYEIVYQGKQKIRSYFKYGQGDSRDLDTEDFMDLIARLAKIHYEKEDKLEALRNADAEPICLPCGFLTSFCKCDKDYETISPINLHQATADVDSKVDIGEHCPCSDHLAGLRNKCYFGEDLSSPCSMCGQPPPPKGGDEHSPHSGFYSYFYDCRISSFVV